VTDMPTGSAQAGSADAEPAREQVVIRDKRKIDASGKPRTADTGGGAGGEQADTVAPKDKAGKGSAPGDGAADESEVVSGEVVDGGEAPSGSDPTAGSPGAAGRPASGEVESLRAQLDERLRDLQRVSAEYANYRKRVERDRGVVAEQAVGMVVGALLPILDDLDRAKDHGDLTGPLASVAEQLNIGLAKFGLAAFGEQGDAFDPTRHEAVAHQTSAEVTEPTCVGVMRRGYLLGERLLWPALVAVADPE